MGILRRPSPAMVVALIALVVAVGGVAFATIPDSAGTIHGCVHKNTGALRVVESGSCRSNERPVSWSSEGSGGIVTRIEGGATFDQDGTKQIPLTGGTWTQGASEFQELVLEMHSRPCADSGLFQLGGFELDGEIIRASASGLALTASDLGSTVSRFTLFEPGVTKTRNLTLELTERCTQASGPNEVSVRGVVLGFR
jgi:hypothetical protein